MKKMLFYSLLSLLFTSCATTVTFPVSSLIPAAEIKATKKKDSHSNFKIKVNANYMASPERLSPSKAVYVVWGLTDNNGVKNLGQLQIKNAKKATLEALTPFDVQEVFITAEDAGNISLPAGTEISRVKF